MILQNHKCIRIIFIISLILSFITIIPSGIIVGIAQYDKWQVRKSIVEIVNCRLDGDLMQAFKKNKSLLLDHPNNVEVLRETARTFLSIWKKDKSIKLARDISQAWESIEKNAEMTPEDRREYAKVTIEIGNPYLAKEIILRAKNVNNIENILLLQQISYLIKDLPEARKLGGQAYKLDKDNPEIKLNYSMTLLKSDSFDDHAIALGILNELIEEKGPIGMKALKVLCSTGSFPREIRLLAASKIRAHPEHDTDSWLVATEIEIVLKKQESKELFQKTVDAFIGSDVKDITIVGQWLNKMIAFKYTVLLIDEISAFSNMDLFLVLGDALAGEGQWGEVERLMNDPRAPLQYFHKNVFLGTANAAQGKLNEAYALWSKALYRGPDINYRLNFLIPHLMNKGYYSCAEKIFRKMISNPLATEIAYTGLINISRKLNKPQDALNILHEMKEHFLSDDRVINDINYYNLLLERDMTSTTNKAYSLYESKKNVLAFRITLSLALLKHNNYEPAFKLLDLKELDWSDQPPYARVIKAITLITNNQHDAGMKLFNSIPRNGMMNLEHNLFNSYLNTMTSKSSQISKH